LAILRLSPQARRPRLLAFRAKLALDRLQLLVQIIFALRLLHLALDRLRIFFST
jgi:hypothetical protein